MLQAWAGQPVTGQPASDVTESSKQQQSHVSPPMSSSSQLDGAQPQTYAQTSAQQQTQRALTHKVCHYCMALLYVNAACQGLLRPGQWLWQPGQSV